MRAAFDRIVDALFPSKSRSRPRPRTAASGAGTLAIDRLEATGLERFGYGCARWGGGPNARVGFPVGADVKQGHSQASATPTQSCAGCPAEFGRVRIDFVTFVRIDKDPGTPPLFLGVRPIMFWGTSRSPLQPEDRNFFSPTHFSKQRAPISYVGRSCSCSDWGRRARSLEA
jgi:hypothetical protein